MPESQRSHAVPHINLLSKHVGILVEEGSLEKRRGHVESLKQGPFSNQYDILYT
jgi:hypothetical protein